MSTTRTTLNKRMRLVELLSSPSQSQFVEINPPRLTTTTTISCEKSQADKQEHEEEEEDDDEQQQMRNVLECDSESLSHHPNVIVHIDIDYFYAQVEEIRDPSLRDRPMGVQQKTCVVTANYRARAHGVRKMMLVPDAKKLCPGLVLVRGEDLTPYRQMSARIFDLVQRTFPTSNVERLGMDENFIDLTKMIAANKTMTDLDEVMEFQGCVFPPSESFSTANTCKCGCVKRLAIGTQIAQQLRDTLYRELGITTCAGIAHNKMLAKLAGQLNKPNNQTVVVPTRARDLMLELRELRSIPGIGQKTESLLKEMRVDAIDGLQVAEQNALVLKFGPEMAKKLKDWSLGVDLTPVRSSNYRPKSIGLEDSCKPLTVRQDIEHRFRGLLVRLVNQVMDDGRVPVTIKVTLRKYDAIKKTSHRETKQATVLPTLFTVSSASSASSGSGGGSGDHYHQQSRLVMVEGGEEKLMRIVMRLFERMVDLRLPFNITLLGLAFSKLQDRRVAGGIASAALANFLIKKSDIEVQSVTSLTSDGLMNAATTHLLSPSPVTGHPLFMAAISRGGLYRERDTETMSDTMSVASDLSTEEQQQQQQLESAVSCCEPSPKKSRLGLNLIPKRRCFQQGGEPMDCASPSKLRVSDLRLNSIDKDRAEQQQPQHHQKEQQDLRTSRPSAAVVTAASVVVPKCVDPDVFKELPAQLQNELTASWTVQQQLNKTFQSNISGGGLPSVMEGNSAKGSSSSSSSRATTKTPLSRYFFTTNK